MVPCPSSESGAVNVFVKKKDGRLRIRTDFRHLNQRTLKKIYPLRDRNSILEILATKRVFSALDLLDGLFNVALEEACRPLTAVKTVRGLVMYAKIPQGLVTSPFVMQRVSRELDKTFYRFRDSVHG
ncbi:Enzymatic polyprotein [Porphyridium purpureum]|uniref:Enzymatic polyprotein n=1 Tax=Porphyridium purpureum TaxID=35688 RepID=A0A5J4YUZ6_PORPP|nr:Enzymatic polyprotein [Porphyridium purpureum]|eukprot:POR0517..scf227_4